jgi:hypothetical protein
MMSWHGLKRSRSLRIDVQRHWACCVVRSIPTWIRSTLHRARRSTKKLFSFDVSSARRHRRYLNPRRCCCRRRCCRHRAQVVLVLVRVVLDRGVAFPLLFLSSRRVSRRCRRSSELNGIVVQSTKFGWLSNLCVDAVIQTNQSKEGQQSGDDNFCPIPVKLNYF